MTEQEACQSQDQQPISSIADTTITTTTPYHLEVDHPEQDDTDTITFSRRAARFLSRYSWYYPSKPNGPSLEEAWHHYEYVTLPRCYRQNDEPLTPQSHHHPHDSVTSEAERHSKLYPILESPLKDLSNFGVSTRMYLSTLLVLAGILGIAGLGNVPLMIYYWGYAPDEKEGVHYMGVTSIRGSAICDATVWVECESCNEYADHFPSYRLDGTYARKNSCNFEDFLAPGLWSFASSCMLLLLMAIASLKQRKAEVVFDEAVQTASDYSICVRNPPPDALDPQEWRRFFNHYAVQGKGVVMVTVAIDNAELLNLLIKRRQALQTLSQNLSDGCSIDDLRAGAVVNKPLLSYIGLATDINKIVKDIQRYEDAIRGLLLHQTFKPSAVFVTFETERSQRNALHALSTGKINIWRQKLNVSDIHNDGILKVYESMRSSTLSDLVDPQKEHVIQLSVSDSRDLDFSSALLFRNYHVLNVKEAAEPSDVRWLDLQASNRLGLYVASTVGMVLACACCGLYIYRLVHQYPGPYATMFITLLNTVVPTICEVIGDFEAHPNEHGKQISLYVKITIFRCFNSAIVLSVISSFIETISVENDNEDRQQSLLYKVYPVIVAELLVNPLADLMDVEGNFRKHFLAPRAKSQQEMNACFRGSRFWLAERYTNANRVIFVALFYTTILPEALFLASLALVAQYYSAKFILLRLSGIAPDLGFHLARTSRNWFIPFVLISHVIMSAYWWSGFPYDNVCENEQTGGYQYCNQNLYSARIFPPLPRFQTEGNHWMTQNQEVLTSLYSWTSVVVLTLGLAEILRNVVMPNLERLFRSTYTPDGKDQGVDFTSVKHHADVHGFIPQVRVPGFVYPLLAADIAGVDEELIGWKDKSQGYDPYNLIHDIEQISKGKPDRPIFSIVQQYDPTHLS